MSPSVVQAKVIPGTASLFDMDGTLIDSSAGLEGAWEAFKETYPHIDVPHILEGMHIYGAFVRWTIYATTSEAIRFEQTIVTSASANGRPGIIRLPGVKDAMGALISRRYLPNPSWAICTSSTKVYSTLALTTSDIPIPEVLVTSETVEKGKPNPDPYLLGAKLCGVDPADCIVIEDSPNGIRSGLAAGCKVVGILTSHSRESVEAVKPNWVAQDLSQLRFALTDAGVEVAIDA
ncbi:hypothetical protein H1R20_g13162, partial [Candolleomyces eurysporus]